MFAFLKISMIAAVALLALSGVATAATISPGAGTIDISAGNGYHYVDAFSVGTGAHTLTFNFKALDDLILSGAADTLELTGRFKNLSVKMDGNVIAKNAGSTAMMRSYSFDPVLLLAGDINTLVISWKKVVMQRHAAADAASISLQMTTVPPVSSVPLPAGGLLLAGALSGIAALRRCTSV